MKNTKVVKTDKQVLNKFIDDIVDTSHQLSKKERKGYIKSLVNSINEEIYIWTYSNGSFFKKIKAKNIEEICKIFRDQKLLTDEQVLNIINKVNKR